MWWRAATWTVRSQLDRDQAYTDLAQFLADRKHRRSWPFFVGHRYSLGEGEFVTSPDLMSRNPYRFKIRGAIEDGTEPAKLTISIQLGVGVFVEGFLIIGCAVVAAGSVAIVLQDTSSLSRIDFAPLLLSLPLVFVVGVGLLARLWLTWRMNAFVKAIATRLNSSFDGRL